MYQRPKRMTNFQFGFDSTQLDCHSIRFAWAESNRIIRSFGSISVSGQYQPLQDKRNHSGTKAHRFAMKAKEEKRMSMIDRSHVNQTGWKVSISLILINRSNDNSLFSCEESSKERQKEKRLSWKSIVLVSFNTGGFESVSNQSCSIRRNLTLHRRTVVTKRIFHLSLLSYRTQFYNSEQMFSLFSDEAKRQNRSI